MTEEQPNTDHFVQFRGKVFLPTPVEYKRGKEYVFVVRAECVEKKEKASRDGEPQLVNVFLVTDSQQAPDKTVES